MPQTKSQKFIFSLLMSYIMAYGMELANVAVKLGGMSNAVFLPALKEASYMGAFVFLVSNLYGNRVGRAIAFRCVQPGRDAPFFITLMISSCTVMIMCPSMSLIATIIFIGVDAQFLANWFATVYHNFAMALLWQLFFAGPVVRLLFRTLFRKQLAQAEH